MVVRYGTTVINTGRLLSVCLSVCLSVHFHNYRFILNSTVYCFSSVHTIKLNEHSMAQVSWTCVVLHFTLTKLEWLAVLGTCVMHPRHAHIHAVPATQQF